MRIVRLAVIVAIAIVGTGWAVQAWAWGDVGHKVVCEIAFHELNPKALAEVTRLIKKDPQFAAFADSCIWPDHPKRRRVEHFINVPSSRGRSQSAVINRDGLCSGTTLRNGA